MGSYILQFIQEDFKLCQYKKSNLTQKGLFQFAKIVEDTSLFSSIKKLIQEISAHIKYSARQERDIDSWNNIRDKVLEALREEKKVDDFSYLQFVKRNNNQGKRNFSNQQKIKIYVKKNPENV